MFTVEDNGPGFDTGVLNGGSGQHMADRIAALGGTLTVTSGPGQGTIVSGRLPAAPRAIDRVSEL
jgi:signal transduction histidine kinase